jgi:hypothetical protein
MPKIVTNGDVAAAVSDEELQRGAEALFGHRTAGFGTFSFQSRQRQERYINEAAAVLKAAAFVRLARDG